MCFLFSWKKDKRRRHRRPQPRGVEELKFAFLLLSLLFFDVLLLLFSLLFPYFLRGGQEILKFVFSLFSSYSVLCLLFLLLAKFQKKKQKHNIHANRTMEERPKQKQKQKSFVLWSNVAFIVFYVSVGMLCIFTINPTLRLFGDIE